MVLLQQHLQTSGSHILALTELQIESTVNTTHLSDNANNYRNTFDLLLTPYQVQSTKTVYSPLGKSDHNLIYTLWLIETIQKICIIYVKYCITTLPIGKNSWHLR